MGNSFLWEESLIVAPDVSGALFLTTFPAWFRGIVSILVS